MGMTKYEEHLAYMREYHKKNRDRYIQYGRAYYTKNRDRLLSQSRIKYYTATEYRERILARKKEQYARRKQERTNAN
jgi:hypothetical protein